MANRSRRKMGPLAALGALVLCAAAGLAAWLTNPAQAPKKQELPQPNGKAQVYFLDVGQGDCELLRLPGGETVLIDAGTGETAQELSAYLKDMGVSRIDCLIATHPHEDHIGGMARVVQDFPIGKLVMPRVADSQTPTTRTYENLLTAAADKGLKITAARAGAVLLEEDGVKLELLAPNSGKYENLNSYSAVAKLTVGQKSFLFTGDAEKDSEKEMLEKGYDLRCDVLKCGHHGSSTSTGAAFLKAVSPKAAVISCGVDNSYGHPHKEVVNRLNKANVALYRTDTQNTILAECDGNDIAFTKNLPSVLPDKAK